MYSKIKLSSPLDNCDVSAQISCWSLSVKIRGTPVKWKPEVEVEMNIITKTFIYNIKYHGSIRVLPQPSKLYHHFAGTLK